MKSQGLPMTTIALIIIVLIVLAGVAIFFFTYFTKSQSGVDAMQCFQLCQAEKAKYESGITPTTANSEYCKSGCHSAYGSCDYGGASALPCT